MKKKLALALSLAALLVFSGCGKEAETKDLAAGEVAEETEETEEETAQEAVEEAAGSGEEADAPGAKEALDAQAFSGMLMAADPLLLAGAETGLAYDPADPVFVWKALVYGIGIYYPEILGAELTESGLLVPEDVLLSYASCLFAGMEALPEIPDDAGVSYGDGAYLFPLGDRGASYAEIIGADEGEDGTLSLHASLIGADDGETILSASFALSAAADGPCPYTVTGMEEIQPAGTMEDNPQE